MFLKTTRTLKGAFFKWDTWYWKHQEENIKILSVGIQTQSFSEKIFIHPTGKEKRMRIQGKPKEQLIIELILKYLTNNDFLQFSKFDQPHIEGEFPHILWSHYLQQYAKESEGTLNKTNHSISSSTYPLLHSKYQENQRWFNQQSFPLFMHYFSKFQANSNLFSHLPKFQIVHILAMKTHERKENNM